MKIALLTLGLSLFASAAPAGDSAARCGRSWRLLTIPGYQYGQAGTYRYNIHVVNADDSRCPPSTVYPTTTEVLDSRGRASNGFATGFEPWHVTLKPGEARDVGMSLRVRSDVVVEPGMYTWHNTAYISAPERTDVGDGTKQSVHFRLVSPSTAPANRYSVAEAIAAVSYFFDGYLTKEQAVRVLESCPDPRCVAAAKQVRAGAPRGAPAKQYSYAETVAVVNLFFAGEVSKEEALRVLRNCVDAKCKAAASGLQAQAPAPAAGTAYTWNEVKTAVDYYFNGHLTKKRVLEILASCSEPRCRTALGNIRGGKR